MLICSYAPGPGIFVYLPHFGLWSRYLDQNDPFILVWANISSSLLSLSQNLFDNDSLLFLRASEKLYRFDCFYLERIESRYSIYLSRSLVVWWEMVLYCLKRGYLLEKPGPGLSLTLMMMLRLFLKIASYLGLTIGKVTSYWPGPGFWVALILLVKVSRLTFDEKLGE